MRDSLMPTRRSGGNKTVIFLLIGGTVIMLVALVVVLVQRSEKPAPKPEEQPEKEEEVVPSPSLVAVKPARPLHAVPEVATEAPTEEPDKKTGKKRRGRHGRLSGEIDTKEVNSFINANFSQVKACYERRLKINSFLEGKLDLNIGILESGKVNLVSVNRDTVKDEQMLSCVKSTIRSWVFPKPENGRVVIAKTFNFKKKDK